MEEKTKKITASTGFADRVYEFKLISPMNGLMIWHEYASIVIGNLSVITDMFKKFFSVDDGEDGALLKLAQTEALEGGGALIDFVTLIPKIVTTPRLMGLCKTLLGGSKIEDEMCDEDGMCELFRGDPLEIYAALFWAITANWPKYMDPLLNALTEEGENDGTQDSKTSSPEKTNDK